MNNKHKFSVRRLLNPISLDHNYDDLESAKSFAISITKNNHDKIYGVYELYKDVLVLHCIAFQGNLFYND